MRQADRQSEVCGVGVVRPRKGYQGGCPGQTPPSPPPDLPPFHMRARAPSCRQVPGSLLFGSRGKVPGVARTSL